MWKSAGPEPIYGNIFEALGLENASELQARVDVAVAITREVRRVIKNDAISKEAVAERIGISREELSMLMRGSVGQFDKEQLECFR